MGLFTRKRPPVYVWDDVWEPVTMCTQCIPFEVTFPDWVVPADYYIHLTAISMSFRPLGAIHTTDFVWQQWDGSTLVRNLGWVGIRTLAEHTITFAPFDRYTISSTAVYPGIAPLTRHAHMTPGQRLHLFVYNAVGADTLNWVSWTFRRYMLR